MVVIVFCLIDFGDWLMFVLFFGEIESECHILKIFDIFIGIIYKKIE
jgi:hypothetical protein